MKSSLDRDKKGLSNKEEHKSFEKELLRTLGL